MGSQFDSASASGPFKVLVLGGAYGGLSVALNVIDLAEGRAARQGNGTVPDHDGDIPIEVTIVDERDGFYHLIGSPLALADSAYAEKNWIKYSDLAALETPKITMIQGSVTSVDPRTKTSTILETSTQTERTLSYDYLAVATGLRRVWPVVPQSLHQKAYLAETGAHIAAVHAAPHGVVVVGGGAVGIEMAAELKLVQPATRVTLVHSRDRLLSNEALPDECKDRAMELLLEAGVEVKMATRLASTTEGQDGQPLVLRFEDGETMEASVVIKAVSAAVPSTAFLPREACDEEGLVRVRGTMQFLPGGVEDADVHFAVGDAIRWSGIKRCGGAMHMGYFAAHNIHELVLQRMRGKTPNFNELGEIPPMIGLAVGKNAVSYGPEQGVRSGEDIMKAFFGNDLGFTICWNWMRLGKPTGAPRDDPVAS